MQNECPNGPLPTFRSYSTRPSIPTPSLAFAQLICHCVRLVTNILTCWRCCDNTVVHWLIYYDYYLGDIFRLLCCFLQLPHHCPSNSSRCTVDELAQPWTKDSSELESYLSSVAIGNLILMGAADEASTAFSSEALLCIVGVKIRPKSTRNGHFDPVWIMVVRIFSCVKSGCLEATATDAFCHCHFLSRRRILWHCAGANWFSKLATGEKSVWHGKAVLGAFWIWTMKHSQPRMNIPLGCGGTILADDHYLGLHPVITFLIIPHIVGIGVSSEGVHTPSLGRKRIALGSLSLRLITELLSCRLIEEIRNPLWNKMGCKWYVFRPLSGRFFCQPVVDKRLPSHVSKSLKPFRTGSRRGGWRLKSSDPMIFPVVSWCFPLFL